MKLLTLTLCAFICLLTACGDATRSAGGPVVIKTAAVGGVKPYEAGKTAAGELKTAFGTTAPKAVVVMDSFEDVANKKELLRGVTEILPGVAIIGGSCYGGFTQKGSLDQDALLLLGIGGEGAVVTTAVVKDMGAAGLNIEKDKDKLTAALNAAGERLAKQLPTTGTNDLLVVIPDAHSPKNQLFLDGMQKVTGPAQAIAGGSVNKNVGQNWVYFGNEVLTDAAVGLRLGGSLVLSQSGQQAKTNDAVIESARTSSAAALKKMSAKPLCVMVFDCAGRKGKLERLEDEIAAIQSSVGRDIPIFGVYCAGEIGTLDAETSPVAKGWHAMFTILGQ
jgi:hypothetical protein